MLAVAAGCAGDGDEATTSTAASSTTTPDPGPLSTGQIVERGAPATVAVVATYGDEGRHAGSGVVVDAEQGYVLTTAAVAAGALEVWTPTRSESVAARVVAARPCDDTALLQITDEADRAGFADALELAPPPSPKRGAAVVALGYGEDAGPETTPGPPSPSEGTVRAARAFGAPSSGETPRLAATIWHDAAIAAGGAGGPLLDDRGRVVGMNTLLAGPTKDAPSLAIASARLARLLPELEQGASRAWTGIVPDWGAGGGFAVAGVTPGSPGEDAGLEAGTRVLGIDGVAVDSLGSYCAVLDRAREEGRAAMWTIARADGQYVRTIPIQTG